MVGTLTVCQNAECARTLHISEPTVVAATSEDTLALTDGERAALKKLRPKAWRDSVQARMREIRGR
jgi:hypothetical protein